MQAAPGDRTSRKRERTALAPRPAAGDPPACGPRIVDGGIGRLFALIVVRPVEVGGVPIARRPDGIAGGGVELLGQCGEAGHCPHATQRASGLARCKCGVKVAARRERPGRPRLRVEHRRGDRVRQPSDKGVDLVEPFACAQRGEPIRDAGEHTGGGIRRVRTGTVDGRYRRRRRRPGAVRRTARGRGTVDGRSVHRHRGRCRHPTRATVKQPCKRRVLGVAHLAPRDHAPGLRPGKRDVQEAHRFGEFFEPFDGLRPLVRI